jgi:hypothetical protein
MPAKDLALPLEPLAPAPFYMKVAPRLFLSWYRFRDQRMARRDGINSPPF